MEIEMRRKKKILECMWQSLKVFFSSFDDDNIKKFRLTNTHTVAHYTASNVYRRKKIDNTRKKSFVDEKKCIKILRKKKCTVGGMRND